MADLPRAQRSLWKEAFAKPEFRSRREKVGYFTYTIGVGLLIVAVAVFQPFDTFLGALPNLLVLLGVPVVQYGGWSVRVAWGRRRFPLPSPGGSLGRFIR
ncbi:MAG: hypothetical protein OXL98_16115 [Acidimicrobiaceae bacterium]|nr:hypothetical protein [Acidimicrobiaceae bacterium]